MFELIKKMLTIMDSEDIKSDKDFQILSGIYKIPDTFGELKQQIKIR